MSGAEGGGGGRPRTRDGKESTGDSGNSGSVFVGGRWDPPFECEQRAKVGIKVEHGAKKGIFAFGLLSPGIELGPNSADLKEK